MSPWATTWFLKVSLALYKALSASFDMSTKEVTPSFTEPLIKKDKEYGGHGHAQNSNKDGIPKGPLVGFSHAGPLLAYQEVHVVQVDSGCHYPVIGLI